MRSVLLMSTACAICSCYAAHKDEAHGSHGSGRHEAACEPDLSLLKLDSAVMVEPGNVLLIFDRSGSMDDLWHGQQRWRAAGAAVQAALSPLASDLLVGALFFPSPDPEALSQCADPTGIACMFVPGLLIPSDGSCSVGPISSEDQIGFAPGPDFLDAFAGPDDELPAYAPLPTGLTPLREALEEANRALQEATLLGVIATVIITDGEPNCAWREDPAIAREVVAAWHARGIATHVVGLPGAGSENTALLDELAMAGGTVAHITPDDAHALQLSMNEIVRTTVRYRLASCEIPVDPPVEHPDNLQLVVAQGGLEQAVPRTLHDSSSWDVDSDGAKIHVRGPLCDDAQAGLFEAIQFGYDCADLPVYVP